MPECRNCGNTVSKDFARTMCKNEDMVLACPECDDAKMENGSKHEYRQ